VGEGHRTAMRSAIDSGAAATPVLVLSVWGCRCVVLRIVRCLLVAPHALDGAGDDSHGGLVSLGSAHVMCLFLDLLGDPACAVLMVSRGDELGCSI